MAKQKRSYVTVGHDSDGKRIRKWITADNVTELKEKISDAKGIHADTFGKYSERWFDLYKGKRAVNTQAFYITALKKLKPLDNMLMSDITRGDVQAIIQANWGHARTCEKIESTVKQIFDAAINDGVAEHNPAFGLHLPKYVKKEKEILTDAELEKVKAIGFPLEYKVFLDFALYLGMRPEEIRALNWDSFDWDEGTVRIDSAVVFKGEKPVKKETKNYQNRTLPMPDVVIADLRAYSAFKNGFYLFNGKNHDMITKTEYRRFCKHIFEPLEPVIGKVTFYIFRHTRGTQLYYLTQKNEISTKLAAWYMGHSEMMFLSIYSHIDETKENVDILRKIL